MRLIINADDLGSNPQVNTAIFDFMAGRLVTSATIMANGPALEQCLAQIPAYPSCSFGIHLNITEFRPLAAHPALKALLDSRGNLSLANYRRARLGPALREAIFWEWSAQVRRLRSAGLEISHLDSHQGVHTDPRLFLVLKRLQRAFGIRKVRIAPNISLNPRIAYRRNRLWNLALRYFYATTTTSGFTDLATFLKAPELIRRQHRSVELMVHPGHPEFAAETLALQTPWTEALPFAVRLISYREL